MSKKKIIITENDIEISGFGNTKFKREHMGSCRDVGRVALAWGLKMLADEMLKDCRGDWDQQKSGIAD